MTARWRAPLCLEAVLTQAGWVGVRLMVGYRALAEGAEPLFLGAVASSFALPALLSAIPAGRVSDRVGGTIMAFIGLLVAAGGILAMVLIPGLPSILACSIVIGFGYLLVMVGQQTFVAHLSARESPDRAFGTLTAAGSIGQLLGPPTVTLVASLGTGPSGALPDANLGLMGCLVFTVLALPTYFFLRRMDATLREGRWTADRAPETTAVPRAHGLWRSLVVSGAVLVTMDLMYAFVPVWATKSEISVTTVGLLLALRAFISVFSRIGLTRLLNVFGRKTLLITSMTAAVIALSALPFSNVFGAIAVMVGLGIGLGIPQPLTMAWVVSLTHPSRHGAALGLRLTVNRLAQICLPLAVGTLAAPLGVLGIFWSNAALLMGAIAVVSGADVAGAGNASKPET